MAKLLVTPKGVAVYPHLQKPDDYEGKRKYKITLRLPADDPKTEQLIEKLESLRDDYWENGEEPKRKFNVKQRAQLKAHPVYRTEEDDDGNPTGFILVSADCNAEFTDRDTGRSVSLKPQLLDAKKKPIPDDVAIWGGSTVRVAFQPYTWAQGGTIKAYGVKMRLKAVQVIDLVSGGGAANVFDEEDGFDVSDDDTASDNSDAFDESVEETDDF